MEEDKTRGLPVLDTEHKQLEVAAGWLAELEDPDHLVSRSNGRLGGSRDNERLRNFVNKAESSRKIKQKNWDHKRQENPKPGKRGIVDRGPPIMRASALNLELGAVMLPSGHWATASQNLETVLLTWVLRSVIQPFVSVWMAGAVSLRTLSRKPLGLKVQAWASSTTLKSCSLPICGFHANRAERMFSLLQHGLQSPSYLPASQGGESLRLFSQDVTFPIPSEGLTILTATQWGWTLSPWKFGDPNTFQVAQNWSVCSSLWLSDLAHFYHVFLTK